MDDESAREDLSKASTLFKYALFCGGSPASLFLKVQAVQQCIANVVVSILQRPYYADTVSDAGHQSLSTLLENMASLQATNSNRELSWRLDTIEKLDRLGSEPSSTTPVILTKHEPMRIVTAIMKKLQRFEFSDKKLIISSLSDIADQTISLWDAMRRDNCKVTFNFSISGLDWNRDIYETCTSEEESPQHIDISETDLPKKSFVIFPQVTGHFIAESGHRVLHGGLMLSHESAAFREGLMDIKRAEMRIEELSQNLRKQPITQPSTPRLSHRRASSVSGQHPKATQKSG